MISPNGESEPTAEPAEPISESFGSGLGREVEVTSVEGELRRLWEADDAATRASLMNFAIFSEDARDLLTNHEAVGTLTRNHACRVLLFGMNRTAEVVKARAWINAHCHLAHGRKTVCSEQVSFLLQGQSQGRMRNILFAHLQSDLPLVFWWQGDFSDIFKQSLFRRIDRLIFDSAQWHHLGDSLSTLKRAIDLSGEELVVQDLAWTRSHEFRVMLAGLFDDPTALQALPALNHIELEYAPGSETAALLWLAWLITQAGWQVNTSQKTIHKPDGQQVHLNMRQQGHCGLTATRLHSEHINITIERDTSSKQLHAELSAPGHQVRQSAPVCAGNSFALVEQQLSRGGRNSLYKKILPTFESILGVFTPSEHN